MSANKIFSSHVACGCACCAALATESKLYFHSTQLHATPHPSADLLYSTAFYSALLCSTLHCFALHNLCLLYSILLYSTLRHSTPFSSTLLCSTPFHSSCFSVPLCST